jgi:hypothetical protein
MIMILQYFWFFRLDLSTTETEELQYHHLKNFNIIVILGDGFAEENLTKRGIKI